MLLPCGKWASLAQRVDACIIWSFALSFNPPCGGSHGPNADHGLLDCRRMFETAVAVGVYHKSDNSININPDEKTVFQPGDQIVVLSNTGDSPSCVLNYTSSAQKEDSQA